jgi:hypothetical protein
LSNRPFKNMKLYTAIINEIREQKKFSAHQITKSLRDKSNAEVIVLDDCPILASDPLETFKEVSHEVVKTTIAEIYDNQILSLKRERTGAFFIYELVDAVQPAPAQNQVTYVAGIGPVRPSVASILRASNPDMEAKVKFYVENKKKLNQPATLRGIHSSLKQKNTKVVDISRVCGTLGYSVVTKTPFYASEVV